MSDARISVAAGFCAGIAETLIGHPFDTIKTKLQTQCVDRVGDRPLYRGPLHCIAITLRREGFRGLYKGVLNPIIQNALGAALLFGAMDWFRERGASIFSPHKFIFACFFIGTIESILYCPFDHIKARLQVDHSKRPRRGNLPREEKSATKEQINSSLNVMREILTARGYFGLYFGYIFQLLKETTGNVALFGTYDIVMYLLGEPGSGRGGSRHAHPDGLHWAHIWPAGSLAGMAYYLTGYPFDTLKSLLQTDSLTHPRYKGSFHAIFCILREEGSVKELYRGLTMCLFRAIPGSAVQFVVFEVVYRSLNTLVHIHQALKPHLSSMGHHFGEIEHLI